MSCDSSVRDAFAYFQLKWKKKGISNKEKAIEKDINNLKQTLSSKISSRAKSGKDDDDDEIFAHAQCIITTS